MCGIAGILNIDGVRPTRPELSDMIVKLRHRGPDGYGFYADGDIGLAHARLSIIDLAGGKQPICNEDGTVWTVFNGEIFNYVELRASLLRDGHVFSTHSDTEVIVHLYEQHGEEFVHHLNGQFSIALWDTRGQKLILVRDRVGIRPLFYTKAGGRLFFASEIKSLFAHAAVRRRINLPALGELFTYWSPLPPSTLFADVSSLPPGHMMTVKAGQMRVRRYWDWHFPESNASDNRPAEECAQALWELLVDAVRLQVRADVPVGAYLSGGLDSAIVVSLLKNFTDTPVRTFSVRFEDAEFDEGVFQRQLVSELDTRHTELVCTSADICAAFPKTIWHTESPLLRTAATPLMLLSEKVLASGYKVVLTGEGADEIMAGYDLFKEAKIRRFCARSPASTVRPALFRRLYPYLSHSPTCSQAYAHKFFSQGMERVGQPYFSHIPRWRTTHRIWRFFSRDALNELGNWDQFLEIEKILPAEIRDWEPLNQDQYVEAHTLLSGYLLCSQGDRVCSANAVEGRFPFLDHRVIEFCNNLPVRYKLMGLKEKYLLKQAARGWIPETIRARTKQPYRAPDSKSFFKQGESAEYVDKLFSESRIRDAGYFDPNATRRLFEKCRRGRAIGFGDNMAFIGILSTMLLDELFIRPGDRENRYANQSNPLPRYQEDRKLIYAA